MRHLVLSLWLSLLVPAEAFAAIDAHALGARYDAARTQITFRVFSSRATRVEVWLYDAPSGADERVRVALTKDAATNVWSADVAASGPGTVYYGYRAWGPNWPFESTWTKGSGVGFQTDVDAQGNRFNPNKLLLDPYAREISHDQLTPGLPDGSRYASGPSFRNVDTGQTAPKGIVLAPDATSFGTKPTRKLADEVIYEVHLRGLTKADSAIPAALRGSYAGAARKAGYLASLGVTAVEFLPLHETQNDTNDMDPSSADGDNYWGYSSLSFFAPDRRYARDKRPGGPTRELKQMVKAFHDRGIKVFVDVVYNHTGEGGLWKQDDSSTANVQSFRGLDNPAYYLLSNDAGFYYDNTGVNGNFNTADPVAQDLIVDSLAYWTNSLGVDGFRFDLASVLGNTCKRGCFHYAKLDPVTALNRIVRELPPRGTDGGAGVDFIGEPWAATGDGVYQMGNFPAGWAEWNDKFRDAMRRDQNKLGVAEVVPGELARRFAGSSDLFQDDGRQPYHSINFMVAHDGLSLRDLYACNSKNNNQPWPFGPSDGGTNDDNAWDQGALAADQRRAARNGLAFLALSAGTPMITGGDESLRSVRCNNNPYNLDAASNWLDWTRTPEQTQFQRFAQRLFAFRRAHPALRPTAFYAGVDTNGNVMEQHRWFKPDGQIPDATYFDDPANHALAWRIDGSEFADPASAIYVAYNGSQNSVQFSLPWPGPSKTWFRVTDTSNWAEGPKQVASAGQEARIGGEHATYDLGARAVLLLVAK